MQYNKISGSTIDSQASMLFKEFEDEKCYLAFLRQTESWGNYALVNISLRNNTLISDIISLGTNAIDSFTDKNVSGAVASDRRIFIYKTISTINDFGGSTSEYTKITALDGHDLKLEYINSNWAVIKGLPINYAEYLNNSASEKFYIIRNNGTTYSPNPDNIAAVAKINVKSVFDNSTYNEAVVMKSVLNGIESVFANQLNLVTNILGEINVNGLLSPNIAISDDDLTNIYSINGTSVTTPATPYFILRKANNQSVKVYDTMYMMKTQDSDGIDTVWHTVGTNAGNNEKYLLFKTTNGFSQKFYVKVSIGSATNDLAIYHESLPYINNTIDSSNNVTDSNPPGLDSTYLKNSEVHESLFDILGLVKIKKNTVGTGLNDLSSKVSFVREMKNEDEKMKYINNYGFAPFPSTSNKRIEEITITTDTPSAHYGNIKKNPESGSGTYLAGSSRLFLYKNPFVIGDNVTIRYYNISSLYEAWKVQSNLKVVGISYQEDYYYIEFDGVISYDIDLSLTPDEEAMAAEYAVIVSDSTDVVIKSQYAVCESYLNATKYNMNRVMIDIAIPKTSNTTGGFSLYNDFYRQIAIVHQPKYYNYANMVQCTDDYYNGNLYDLVNHKYDIGTVLFLANKTPICRLYITDKEIFKLII